MPRDESCRAMRLTSAVLVVLAAGCEASAPRLARGDRPPAFVLTQLDAVPLRFPEDVRGRPVIIRFWAGWCPFCEKELQDLEAFRARHRDTGVAVLAVNVGQPPETVAEYVKKAGATYAALVDQESSVARLYGVLSLPTTFFVSRNGTIQAKLLGQGDRETFERMAREIL